MVAELMPIGEFFADRVVFLTGASGFLGRIALEKILRSCPRVKKVYIMLRGKAGKDCAQRLEALLDSAIFARLAAEEPSYKEKVHMVAGDCCLPDLALRPEARARLVAEVEVVIHWAATVRFDENLKVATNVNVRALRDLVRMAREMPQLQAFLHVSTAFAHCVRHDIDEIFYDTPLSGAGLIGMMEALDARLVADITPQLLGKWPNSYVFTKAVAENLLRDEGRGLPIGIVRPAIVLASYKEPVPGWIDNVYGATGILIGCAVGLLRILQTDLSCAAEMIPADFVVNATLAAAVDVNQRFETSVEAAKRSLLRAEEAVPIYNIVTSTLKCIDWDTFMKLSHKHCLDIPSPKVLWHSHTFFTANYYLYAIGAFFLHTIPAHVIDLIALALGRKAVMVKGYKRIHKFASVISYFSTRSWKFHNANMQRLFQRLQLADRGAFDFNVAALDWNDYFHHYIRGGRRFLLKDTLATVPAGRRKLRILRLAHYALCALLLCGVYKLFTSIVGAAHC